MLGRVSAVALAFGLLMAASWTAWSKKSVGLREIRLDVPWRSDYFISLSTRAASMQSLNPEYGRALCASGRIDLNSVPPVALARGNRAMGRCWNIRRSMVGGMRVRPTWPFHWTMGRYATLDFADGDTLVCEDFKKDRRDSVSSRSCARIA